MSGTILLELAYLGEDMKRLIAFAAVASLAFSVTPALAGKKPKPYKSEVVATGIAHPVFYGQSGSVNAITAKEFENSCSIPASNGLDGFVFEIPKAYQGIQAMIEALGSNSGSPAGYDLDIYMYDKSCAQTFASNAAGTDESAVIPKGTAFVFVHNYQGEPNTQAQITLKPY